MTHNHLASNITSYLLQGISTLIRVFSFVLFCWNSHCTLNTPLEEQILMPRTFHFEPFIHITNLIQITLARQAVYKVMPILQMGEYGKIA